MGHIEEQQESLLPLPKSTCLSAVKEDCNPVFGESYPMCDIFPQFRDRFRIRTVREWLSSYVTDHDMHKYQERVSSIVARLIPVLPNGGHLRDYDAIRLPRGAQAFTANHCAPVQ